MKENLGIKIFDQLYVGFHRHGDRMPVGRMVNYVDNKTNQKLRDKIEDWSAYGAGSKAKLNSLIIDNKPMTGFRISRSQINAGWYQTPDYIRVEDPRGFEVDITIPNMIMLTNNNILDNGEIMHECIWGRDNAINVLLPVNSVPYKEAMQNTDRQTTHVHVSKLKLGDHVVLKNGMKGRYMGKLTAISELYETTKSGHSGYSYYNSSRAWESNVSSHYLSVDSPQHYIEQLTIDNNGVPHRRYLGYSSPNVSRVEESDPLTSAEINQRLMDAYETGFTHAGKSYYTVMLIHGTPEFRNWKTVPIDKVELEQHINRVKPRSSSGYRLLSKYYAKSTATGDRLICLNANQSFSTFPATTTYEYATLNDTKMQVSIETTNGLMVNVADLAFEQLEFEIYVESTDQTFKVKV
jgi:hypothetical protein